MELEIGQKLLGAEYQSELNQIRILKNGILVWSGSFDGDIELTNLPVNKDWLTEVKEIRVGYCLISNLNFVQYFPNTQEIYVDTSTVKDISSLRFLVNLYLLDLQRPQCNISVLGDIESLKKLYLGNWVSGANSITNLRQLEVVEIQKFGHASFEKFEKWSNLKEVWMHAGKLETLKGINKNIKKIQLTSLRKLKDLRALSDCKDLNLLRIEGCKSLNSLDGIENCQQLEALALTRLGEIQSLRPVKNLKKLKQLYVADGTKILSPDPSIFNNLHNLEELIVTKSSGIKLAEKFLENTNCNLKVVT